MLEEVNVQYRSIEQIYWSHLQWRGIICTLQARSSKIASSKNANAIKRYRASQQTLPPHPPETSWN